MSSADYFTMNVISESVAEFKICSSIPSPFLPSFLLHFSPGPPAMALLPSWHTSLPYQLHPVLGGGISIPNPRRGRSRDPQVQGLCLSSGFCALWALLFPFPDCYCICHQVVGAETTAWHGDTLDIWVTHVCRVCVWCQLSYVINGMQVGMLKEWWQNAKCWSILKKKNIVVCLC